MRPQNSSSNSDSKGSMATVILDYEASGSDELTLRKGAKVEVLSKNLAKGEGWWKGKMGDRVGTFPSMYVADNRRSGRALHYQIQPLEIDSRELKMLERVGSGASADVHRAIWKGEEVAVKKFNNFSDERITKKFRNEAKVFWLLRHPNIIPMLGMCMTPEQPTSQDPHQCHHHANGPMLVMEFARGGILHDAVKKPLPPDVVVDWAIQLAKGMRYLHDETPYLTLIHRDLKSKNIVIKEEIVENDYRNKTLKITDFGLARVITHTTHASAFAGTYAWMAPEVIQNRSISKACDVWSYGVVLWELLSGSVPYENWDWINIIVGVGKKTLKLLIPSSCPPLFKDLLTSCLDFEERNRPNFSMILEKLEIISKSDFVRDEKAFRDLRIKWWEELKRERPRAASSSQYSTTNSTTRTIMHVKDKSDADPYKVPLEEFIAINHKADALAQDVFDKDVQILEHEISLLLLTQTDENNNNNNRRKKNNKRKNKKDGNLEIGPPEDFHHIWKTERRDANSTTRSPAFRTTYIEPKMQKKLSKSQPKKKKVPTATLR